MIDKEIYKWSWKIIAFLTKHTLFKEFKYFINKQNLSLVIKHKRMVEINMLGCYYFPKNIICISSEFINMGKDIE